MDQNWQFWRTKTCIAFGNLPKRQRFSENYFSKSFSQIVQKVEKLYSRYELISISRSIDVFLMQTPQLGKRKISRHRVWSFAIQLHATQSSSKGSAEEGVANGPTGLHWSVGRLLAVGDLGPKSSRSSKSRTDRVRMDLLLIDILNIKVANRCATHGHWKAKVSALHCLKIFKLSCCILYALQIVLHAQLELFLRGAWGFPGAKQRRWILSRRRLKRWGLCVLYMCIPVLMLAKIGTTGRMSQDLSNL